MQIKTLDVIFNVFIVFTWLLFFFHMYLFFKCRAMDKGIPEIMYNHEKYAVNYYENYEVAEHLEEFW